MLLFTTRHDLSFERGAQIFASSLEALTWTAAYQESLDMDGNSAKAKELQTCSQHFKFAKRSISSGPSYGQCSQISDSHAQECLLPDYLWLFCEELVNMSLCGKGLNHPPGTGLSGLLWEQDHAP